jgi:hypothetical protein
MPVLGMVRHGFDQAMVPRDHRAREVIDHLADAVVQTGLRDAVPQ